MIFKVFLDANIVLDFVLKRAGFDEGKTIIGWAESGRINGFVSPSVVQICAYWMAKAYGTPKTKEIIAALLEFLTCIDIPHEQIIFALHSSMDDIEDAFQYYTANYHQLDFVISRDKMFEKSDFPSLPVIAPAEFIRMLD